MLVDMLMSKRRVQVKSLAMKAKLQPPVVTRAQTKAKKTKGNFDFTARPPQLAGQCNTALSTNRKRMLLN